MCCYISTCAHEDQGSCWKGSSNQCAVHCSFLAQAPEESGAGEPSVGWVPAPSVGWEQGRMAPEVRSSLQMSSRDFDASVRGLNEFILFEVHDSRRRPQGLAVGQIIQVYKPDRDGAFVSLTYTGCSDQYYDWWRRNEMAAGAFHHLCRTEIRNCESKVGTEAVVHILKWIGITRREAEEFMKSWGAGTLAPPKKRMRPIEDVPEVDHHPSTSAKGAPPTRPATVAPAVSHGRAKHPTHGRSEERRKPESGRRHRRKKEDDKAREEPREKRRRRRSSPRKDIKSEVDYDDLDTSVSPTEDSEKEDQAEDVESKSPRVKSVKAPRVSALRNPMTALDSLLDDDGKDPMPDEAAGNLEVEANKKLKTLRESLEKKRAESSKLKGPGAVLADRAAEFAKTHSKDKRRKSKGKEFVDVLRKALTSKSSRSRGSDGKAEGAEDDSSSDDSDASSQEFAAGSDFGGDSSKAARNQRRLKALSERKPGVLLNRGFTTMHQQVGTFYGEGSLQAEDKVLTPVAVRYLMTVVFPQFKEGIAEGKLRELRTLATGLDLLVQGRTGQSADLFLQRFKSLLTSLRDRTDAAARWLELLPTEIYPTATTYAEDLFARGLAVSAAKSEALLHQASRQR